MNAHTRTRNLLIAGFCLLTLGATDYDDSPEAWETLVDLELAGKLLTVYLEAQPGLVFPESTMPLDEFATGLPPLYSSRLPKHDGWGHKFLVGKVGHEIVILSKGRDGLSDIPHDVEKFFDEIDYGTETIEEHLGDDILFAGREGVINGPRTLAWRQKQTMMDVRSLAILVEEFLLDNDSYPMQAEGLQGLETIWKHLVRPYMDILPMNDAWGNPFLYWSDRQSYVLVSAGADGRLDREWHELSPGDVPLLGECEDPNAEIVMGDGRFRQWPATER